MKKMILVLIFFVTADLSARDAMLADVQGHRTAEKTLQLIKKIKKSKYKKKNLYLGILYHNMVNRSEGNEKYLGKAISLCDKVYKKSKNPLALAYYGSALTLQARIHSRQKKYLKAAKKIEQGFELIDLAIYKKPNLLDLHILRLVNGVSVAENSPFKNRFEIVKKDIAFLSKIYSKLSNNNKSLYHLYYGKINLHDKKINQAIKNFKIAKQVAPDSGTAQDAARKLIELEE